MALHAPGNRRERILVYGLSKQGKSTTWVDIAEWMHRTSSPQKIWLGDSDVAWEAMRPVDGHLDSIVVHRDLNSMDDYRAWITEVINKANSNRNDWLVLDMADRVYKRSMEEFYFRRFGKALDEFFLENGDDATKIGGGYGKNWDVINKIYDNIMDKVHRFAGHVLVCTPARPVRMPTEKSAKFADNEQVRDMFGQIGYKPEGQELLPHLFHSVLYVVRSPSGVRLTTVGDRQRVAFNGELIGKLGETPQFVAKYLIGAAGWRP